MSVSLKYFSKSVLWIAAILLINGCQSTGERESHRNYLDKSASPYLKEHADNPVAWREWNDETLAEAQKQNKPLIISIGYSSCHWCHVMEEESFMDTAVANVMNRNFICVKVDREERPDVDQVYITAAELMNGSAGWPLNAFALSDGKPFFATTYLPNAQWKDLLGKISKAFQDQKEAVFKQAGALTKAIQKSTEIVSSEIASKKGLDELYVNMLVSAYDKDNGGLKGAPKFPLPVNIQLLLENYAATKNKQALDVATVTLDKIAMGGISDHVGGGFARYSTDEKWHVPHFEKMLYDNAQLLSVYAHLFQIRRSARYGSIIKRTVRFIKQELRSPEGAFYSSVNADSEGEEGRFYVWSKEEISKAVTNPSMFCDFFSVTDAGNWENGKNTLHQAKSIEQFATERSLKADEVEHSIDESLDRLRKVGAARVHPSVDTKIITSWNALMITGLVDAAQATQDTGYVEDALTAGKFLSTRMLRDDNRLWHNFLDGKNSVDGFLDDYAFTAAAFIKLYEVTFDKEWLSKSKRLTDFAIDHFSDSTSSLLFYTSDMFQITVARKKEITDNVIPSSNAQMAKVLMQLGEYFQEEKYTRRAEQMLGEISPLLNSPNPFFSLWASSVLVGNHGAVEVAIVGDKAITIARQLQTDFHPLTIYLGGNEENLPLLENKKIEGQTTVFVCRNRVCKRPVTSAAEARELLVKTE